MAQILVFDAHCPQCSRVAKEFARISSGRITIRSLDDPEVVAILDRVRPGWRPQPMLVSDDGKTVQVRTGIRMGAGIAREVGVRQTARLLRVLSEAPTSASSSGGVSRRTAVARGAVAVGGLLFGSNTLASSALAKTMPASGPPTLVVDKAILARLKGYPDVQAAIKALWSA